MGDATRRELEKVKAALEAQAPAGAAPDPFEDRSGTVEARAGRGGETAAADG